MVDVDDDPKYWLLVNVGIDTLDSLVSVLTEDDAGTVSTSDSVDDEKAGSISVSVVELEDVL